VRLIEHVLQQAELIEEQRRARLQHLAAEFALEILAAFQHQHFGTTLREEQAKHQSARPAADDTHIHATRFHRASLISIPAPAVSSRPAPEGTGATVTPFRRPS